MRSQLKLRSVRPIHLTVAATMLALPASAVALSATATTPGQPATTLPGDPPGPLKVQVRARRMAYGDEVTVRGVAPVSNAGRTLRLEAAPTSHSRWQVLASTSIGAQGRFVLTASLRKSAFVKVLDPTVGSSTLTATASSIAGAAALPASIPQWVVVAAEFQVRSRAFDVLDGQAIDVRGRLLPGVAGRSVRLQGLSGRRWRALAAARTGARGGFDVRYASGGRGAALGSQRLRVLFPGDRANARSSRQAGRVTVYQQSVASWYDDAGGTACGFHATFGVANRTLPCGTKVTFRHNGHTVNAVVDDRGPFVGGRDWDLNQNAAAALGFSGVDSVWTTM